MTSIKILSVVAVFCLLILGITESASSTFKAKLDIQSKIIEDKLSTMHNLNKQQVRDVRDLKAKLEAEIPQYDSSMKN